MNVCPRSVYQELLSGYQSKFQQTVNRLKWISLVRLLVFALIVLSVVYLWRFGAQVVVPVIVLLFVSFLYLVKIYILKEKEKQFYQNLICINEDELKALDGGFQPFQGRQ